jgi:hypothetical protein
LLNAGAAADAGIWLFEHTLPAGCLLGLQVPFLGRVPLDPALSRAGEEGRSVFEAVAGGGSKGSSGSSSAPALQAIIDKLLVVTGGAAP